MRESQRPAGIDTLLQATNGDSRTYVDPADPNTIRHITIPKYDASLLGIALNFDSTAADYTDPDSGL